MLLCCPSTLASSWLKALSPIPFPRLTRVLRRAQARRRPPAPNLAQRLHPNLRLKQPRKRTQSRGGTVRARRASNSQTVVLCVLAWIRPGGMWQECIDRWAGTRAGTEPGSPNKRSSLHDHLGAFYAWVVGRIPPAKAFMANRTDGASLCSIVTSLSGSTTRREPSVMFNASTGISRTMKNSLLMVSPSTSNSVPL